LKLEKKFEKFSSGELSKLLLAGSAQTLLTGILIARDHHHQRVTDILTLAD
jgi:hypothetical protein